MQDTPDTTKKMSAEDCWARLQANNLGRLVLTDGNFVDVLPVLYGVADHEIYLRTTRGDRFSAVVMSSQEIHDIAVAIGIDPASDDLSGLRYGKICILADADSDGLHIATLNDKGKIEIDLTVERGRGYVSAAQNKGFDDEIGRIPIDSIYSPVLKVSYKVEATRVEQRTDFDKLIVDVEVKPSTTPRDALASAGKTLVELFGLCVDLNNEAEGIEIGPAPVVETQSSDLQRPITILNLPARSQNCLQREGIRTIGELIQRSEADLLDIRNFGAKSIEDVKDELAKLDLRLKDSPAGFVSTYGDESYTMQFSDDSQA